jgi:hypothetical protein
MANIIYNGTIVGQLLIDPAGTNMGIQWGENCENNIKAELWNTFMKNFPTGQKIENKDIDLSSL